MCSDKIFFNGCAIFLFSMINYLNGLAEKLMLQISEMLQNDCRSVLCNFGYNKRKNIMLDSFIINISLYMEIFAEV